MTKLDDATRLRHMMDSAQKLLEFSAGKTQEAIEADEILSLAIVRLTEIIGEAATNVSQEKRDRYSQIQWGRIIGMRNRIVRAYFDIDMEVVWQTITMDIPTLISQLEAVFRAEGIEL
jgi:uncharacterized protein with HEPN domain